MRNLATPHTSWCDQESCYTRSDGQVVHRSAGRPFDLDNGQVWTACMLWVQLVDTGNGVEVGISVEGAITRMTAALIPETAAELGEALLDHAERAQGLSQLAE